MKRLVEVDELVLGVRIGCAPLANEEQAEMVDVLEAADIARGANRDPLERLAHLEDLSASLMRDRGDDQLAARPRGEEAFLLEAIQGVADRRLRDAERLRERTLGQD